MIRKLLFAISLSLVATPVLAQNIQCPNRPSGDSSNACANTRFVQDTASGPFTTTGPVTINPPVGTQDQGLIIHQTGPNTGTIDANFAYNSIFVNGNALGANAVNTETTGFGVTIATGGTNESGSVSAVYGLLSHNTPTPANINKGDHVGGHFAALSTVNDGGTDTGAGAAGTVFGGALQAQCGNGATFYFACVGTENDAAILTGGSARYRFGTSTVDNGNLQAASLDAAYEFGSAGGPGFKTGFLLDNIHGSAPLSTSGCVICTDGSTNTITTGVDLSPYTISGNFLKGPNGFAVSGSGIVSVSDGTAVGIWNGNSLFGHSIEIGTTTNHNFDFVTNNTLAGYFDTNQALNLGVIGGVNGSLIINGSTNGSLKQTVPASAGSPVITWGSSTGTPAVTASAPLAITSATGNITCSTCVISNRMMVSGSSAGSFAAGTTAFLGPQGGLTTPQTTSWIIPFTSTAKNLFFNVATAPGVGQTFTITVFTGSYNSASASTMTCQIAGTNTSCTDATHSAAITAGQVVVYQIVSSAGAATISGIAAGLEISIP